MSTRASGKPSASLFAPLLSEGGPRGRAEEERICCERRGLPASLEGVGAASELRTASSRDDMVYTVVLYTGIFGGGFGGGVVNTRNAFALSGGLCTLDRGRLKVVSLRGYSDHLEVLSSRVWSRLGKSQYEREQTEKVHHINVVTRADHQVCIRE